MLDKKGARGFIKVEKPIESFKGPTVVLQDMEDMMFVSQTTEEDRRNF
jgi:hypothetical protein